MNRVYLEWPPTIKNLVKNIFILIHKNENLNSSSKAGSKIEKCPESTETKLDHEPWNHVKFLHRMEEVHQHQHQTHPKPLMYEISSEIKI